jgi:uncharacterized membrane protein YoaK (UPF0700 family)
MSKVPVGLGGLVSSICGLLLAREIYSEDHSASFVSFPLASEAAYVLATFLTVYGILAVVIAIGSRRMGKVLSSLVGVMSFFCGLLLAGHIYRQYYPRRLGPMLNVGYLFAAILMECGLLAIVYAIPSLSTDS